MLLQLYRKTIHTTSQMKCFDTVHKTQNKNSLGKDKFSHSVKTNALSFLKNLHIQRLHKIGN